MPTTLARFSRSCKLALKGANGLFFLRVRQAERHFLEAAGAGGLELLSDLLGDDASANYSPKTLAKARIESQ
jgi:hypothetical protein